MIVGTALLTGITGIVTFTRIEGLRASYTMLTVIGAPTGKLSAPITRTGLSSVTWVSAFTWLYPVLTVWSGVTGVCTHTVTLIAAVISDAGLSRATGSTLAGVVYLVTSLSIMTGVSTSTLRGVVLVHEAFLLGMTGVVTFTGVYSDVTIFSSHTGVVTSTSWHTLVICWAGGTATTSNTVTYLICSAAVWAIVTSVCTLTVRSRRSVVAGLCRVTQTRSYTGTGLDGIRACRSSLARVSTTTGRSSVHLHACLSESAWVVTLACVLPGAAVRSDVTWVSTVALRVSTNHVTGLSSITWGVTVTGRDWDVTVVSLHTGITDASWSKMCVLATSWKSRDVNMIFIPVCTIKCIRYANVWQKTDASIANVLQKWTEEYFEMIVKLWHCWHTPYIMSVIIDRALVFWITPSPTILLY